MPNTYAMLSGLNYYDDPLNRLNGCINDMLDFQALLRKNGVPDANITTLSDDPKRKGIDVYPSKDNIIAHMRATARKAQPGDTVIFTYSGHGTYSRDKGGDEADKRDEAIYTADGKLIMDDEFYAEVSKLPKGVRVFVVMDCCHSASILDLKKGIGKDESKRKDDNSHGFVVMISGCQDDQTSADAFLRDLSRGRKVNNREIVQERDGGKRYRGALTASFMDMVAQKESNDGLGFKAILNDLFSGQKPLMRSLQKIMLTWLQAGRFDQVPNIAYEGFLAPVVELRDPMQGYHVGSYFLRNTPARDPYYNDSDLVEEAAIAERILARMR